MNEVVNEYEVGPGMEVTLNFALLMEDGSEVDSTKDKAATFVIGDGNLLPGFEKKLFGLKAGDADKFTMSPEDGFGQPNPQNVQNFARSEFESDMELEVGLVISFADMTKSELPGVVKSFDDKNVEVDFNHPLAGETLQFDVEVVAVKPAVVH